MRKRILFGGDKHKRPVDITTIRGYVNAVRKTQLDIMDKIEELRVNAFVSLGDWYDAGYGSDVPSSYVDNDLDNQMRDRLHGEFYGVIGNHIHIRMDSNPELLLMQPHPHFKSRAKVERDYQVIRTPEFLRYGDVQITFCHFDIEKKRISEYAPKRQEGVKFHIALFHTPLLVPNYLYSDSRYSYVHTTNTDLAIALEDVDYAIGGDIHIPVGLFEVKTSRGICPVYIPGSLTNTESSESSRHHSVNLPMIDIDTETSEVSITYVPISLNTNLLEFCDKALEAQNNKIKNLRGKDIPELYDVKEGASIMFASDRHKSLRHFLDSQGYTVRDRNLVKAVITDPSNVAELVKIFKMEVDL